MADLKELGSYRLLRRLATGGFASVYVGYHAERPDIQVAIKVLSSEHQDPAQVRRFLDEARIASLLRHPNLVRVTDSGSADGRLYQVMELLEGVTVAGLIESKGALEPGAVVSLGIQICEGLAFAHNAVGP